MAYEIDESQKANLREIFLSIEGLLDLAKLGHKNIVISVIGHATDGLDDQSNLRISILRAEGVCL